MPSDNRVIIAMSGGVDSSAAAFLLKEQGFEVIGITMKLWKDMNTSSMDEVINDARRVAEHIGIPHYVINLRGRFKEKVVDYFIDEYINGRTPNPCVACNKFIKFGELLKKASEFDAKFLATGHYAILEQDTSKKRYIIKKAVDRKKDQSYTLYNLTQKQLKHLKFPLGKYKKNEIRSIAQKAGLNVFDKPDSQEICFVPNDDYQQYLQNKVPEKIKPGLIVDANGNKVGKHNGIPYYTIGQRRGLGVALGKPVYVKKIDPKKNQIIVGFEEDVYEKGLIVDKLNLVSLDKIDEKITVGCKIRYNAKEVKASVEQVSDDEAKVIFKEPQKGVAPGQSAVFYQDDVLIGGGIIKKPV